MIAQVDVGVEHGMRLRAALLVYGSESNFFGGTSKVGEAYAVAARAHTDGARVALDPWQPVTTEFVQALAQGLGVSLPREVLPENVLCRTQEVVVWWTKPGLRTLFFSDTLKMGKLDGEDFPVPALVWRLDLKDRRLRLRALRAARRPAAGTPLFVAPFLNVYPDGLVCQGSMRRPKVASVAELAAWESGFFGAAGTSQLTPKACARGQLPALWKRLKGKKAFPAAELLDTGQTLAAFLEVK